MKRFSLSRTLSLLLCVLVLISVLTLTSCEDIFHSPADDPSGPADDSGDSSANDPEPAPAHTHTYASEWTDNEEMHWHAATCEHTDEKSDLAAHAWDAGKVTVPATEDSAGVMTYTCTVCGRTKTAEIPELSHEHTYSSEWTTDDSYHWHTATCGHTGEVSEKALHTFDSGKQVSSPTHAGPETVYTCTVCGYETNEDPNHVHTYAETWSHDINSHWHAATCEHTDKKSDLAAHTWNDGEVTVPATEDATGLKTYTCTVCGETKAEEIAKLPHTHQYSSVWSHDAEGHWHASACGHDVTADYAAHTLKDGVCTVCGLTAGSYTRVNLNGTENKNGEYVVFGSYPQSLVADPTVISSLNAAAGVNPTTMKVSDAWISYGYFDDTASGDMKYIDVTINNIRFRGVTFDIYRNQTAGSSDADGEHSFQDDNGYEPGKIYWFGYDPLKWQIISLNGDDALLICQSVIDAQPYQKLIGTNAGGYVVKGTDLSANNYEASSIRAWLNNDFYNTAFTEAERMLIAKTTVKNDAVSTNPDTSSKEFNDGVNDNACGDTLDKIFLLSMQEATTYEYGFDTNYRGYDSARRKNASDYAKLQGVQLMQIAGSETATWMLRSSAGTHDISVANVAGRGTADWWCHANSTFCGVLPALHLTLTYQTDEPAYTRTDLDGTENKNGEYIEFGSYPQSQVTSSRMIAQLNSLVGHPYFGESDDPEYTPYWSYYNYKDAQGNVLSFCYVDVIYGGVKYRGVGFNEARNDYQGENGYDIQTVYWFAYEPLKWRIAEDKDGSALLICETIIDSQPYQEKLEWKSGQCYIPGTEISGDHYDTSTIREWLNDTFYYTAFNYIERQLIETTAVDNSLLSVTPVGQTKVNPNVCETTNDKIFLLSLREMTTSDYGYLEDNYKCDLARQKDVSDYAKSQGIQINENGHGMWFLRSPSSNSGAYWYVDHRGCTSATIYLTNNYGGVVPALRITLA